MLVAAFGRADTELRSRGEPDLSDVDAHEVYRGAVSVMMRVVFVLFAEERGLLPSDNDLYAKAYSAGGLNAELERRALEGSEDELQNTYTAWHRLLALFQAVYAGVDHPRLQMHAHDGSLFDPQAFAWMPLIIDDQTVLHMLNAVQHVEVGTGKNKERRTLSFRALDVEQIGYVYEGLLSYDGFRAGELVVGLVGKEGREEEVPLRRLEELAARHTDVAALAEAAAAEFKDSGIGSKRALEKKLAPLSGQEKEEARSLLLAVTRRDYPLAERLLPFYRMLRTDLRGLPMVVMSGELYVTESALRKNTGTHYTPRFLAEEVVEGALEPLVYEPGPLQTADKDTWRLKSSEQILGLKVADIAMGSAAFLVAAARYLGARLIEAWTAENDPRVREHAEAGAGGAAQGGVGAGASASTDDDPLVIEARRHVIEHCLYGVDINPMAVEMAKLSLWLVSMDPRRPFTFLDDRLAAGDSLLGITSIEQLEYMHMDPKKGRELHEEGALVDFTAGVRELVSEVAETRRELAEIDGTSLEGLQRKREALREAEEKTGQAKLLADLTVGAALANAGHGERALARGSLEAAELGQRAVEGDGAEARSAAAEWLDIERPVGSFPRRPIHWPLMFPEVFADRGFNSIIGNPPFLGGSKISGSMGPSYRDILTLDIANNKKGNADLIAFFVLRAHQLLSSNGQSGIIATNTLSQGDTREVGLDQLSTQEITIRRATKSSPWPSKSAALEFCTVWTSVSKPSTTAKITLDGQPVRAITPTLSPESRSTGNPHKLNANIKIAFQASKIDGLGFTLSEETAKEWISQDPKNRDVLFPFLNGKDLNTISTHDASRWVIDFRNWPHEKALQYKKPYEQTRRLVKPERENNNRKIRRERWWVFAETAPGLYSAISNLSSVIALTRVNRFVLPARISTGPVFSEAVVIFASGSSALLATLSGSLHYWWAKSHASSMKADLRYTPSDVFETFPLPPLTEELRTLGDRLDTYRRDVMLSRQSGLTKTYNMVFDPTVTDSDIQELRDIHRAIDEATVRAYGWEDRVESVGGLDHGFHQVGGHETRYTIGPAAQREILDSLLELNHERYAEEEAQGLHDKKNKKSKGKADDEGTLF
ncbi:Eco57I restriction-modification methylase domain-containing protein [Streptomonospora salina]